GWETVLVIDPGENHDRHFRAIVDAVGTATVIGILPTHSHPDHWPLAPRLAAVLGSITLGYKPMNGFVPDRLLKDGSTIEGQGWTLEALYTPGHVSDHLSLLLREERALFSGDHVMGWSTSVITRPDGNLRSYLKSLERIRPLDLSVLYPAHGEPVPD